MYYLSYGFFNYFMKLSAQLKRAPERQQSPPGSQMYKQNDDIDQLPPIIVARCGNILYEYV